LSLGVGPGLLVNAWLKDHSHRPRPTQVVAFGGHEAFQPWFSFGGECGTNCSFASGEAAAAAWLVAPASLVLPPLRGPAMVAAGLFAVAVAALRMAFGGHFLSDIIAGMLITLASIVLFAWLLRPFRERAPPRIEPAREQPEAADPRVSYDGEAR
jgi:membrane-associated phospholipid phosphatase